jgi:hypothetical protein
MKSSQELVVQHASSTMSVDETDLIRKGLAKMSQLREVSLSYLARDVAHTNCPDPFFLARVEAGVKKISKLKPVI